MKKKDIILFLSLIIICGGLFAVNKIFNSAKGGDVEIYVDNKLYKKLPLSSNEKIEIVNGKAKNIVYIHDNGVEMEYANCHDHICEQTGFIKDSSKSIVCLPHKINVKVVAPQKEGDLDVTTN